MKRESYILPLVELGDVLLQVDKPSRYLGGECFAAARKQPNDTRLKIALSFPDLYEIGMSNNAIRILYSMLNAEKEALICERVFSPAPDFEQALIHTNFPLYTLESGMPLYMADILAFSIGYELLATNILAIIDRGWIPLLAKEREDADPIVIAGGPAITNPLPFSLFLDAVWIGEAEAGFVEVMKKLVELKRSCASRKEKLKLLSEQPSIWISPYVERKYGLTKKNKVLRAVFKEFPITANLPEFPIPTLNPVHAHGTIEIMRGCPNGCRFCHAGYFYRPQRAKSMEVIKKEAEYLIRLGYKEITLSSLSSGDYPNIVELFDELNATWSQAKVSFQLPSLKVESFTLPLLEKISQVRKSGLTFAVETPLDSWQSVINKRVPIDRIEAILHEAKSKGFRSAKFYFMIGLPIPERGIREAQEISIFIEKIAAFENMAIHVNIGTFIPKPHTPFERESQMSEDEALECITYIRRRLKPIRNVEISFHPPFLSALEGIISRGDESVGALMHEAYKHGARLDAWDDHMNRVLWKEMLIKFNAQKGEGTWQEILTEKPTGIALPWESISMRVSQKWFLKERKKAAGEIFTLACNDNCTDKCGVCTKNLKVVSNNIHSIHSDLDNSCGFNDNSSMLSRFAPNGMENSFVIKLKGLWSKTGLAVFYPLHDVEKAIIRSFKVVGFPLLFSQGFNPQPKFELSPPLPLGVEGAQELFIVKLSIREGSLQDFLAFLADNINELVRYLNLNLPSGLSILKMELSLQQGNKRTIGRAFSNAVWEYKFLSKNSFEAAQKVLSNNENAYKILRIDEVDLGIELIEEFIGTLGKSKNLYKELKAYYQSKMIPLSEIKAKRIKCLTNAELCYEDAYEIL